MEEDHGKAVTPALRKEWTDFDLSVNRFAIQLQQAESSFAFAFIEGTLVKAIQRGDWVLLDEINLATAETLNCLNGLLESEV